MSIKEIEMMLKDYLNIPDNWDKHDYDMPLYCFYTIVDVVDMVLNEKEKTKEN